MNRTMKIGIAAGSAVVAILSAAPATSQQLSYAVTTDERRPDPAQLERQAEQLYSSPKSFKRAADLLMRAAELREPGDPLKVRDQHLAGKLYYYAGDKQRSMDIFERTADHALNVGDVLRAAELYLDGCYVAQELKLGEQTRRLAEKTRLLMNSPYVDASDRERLLSRIRG